MANANANPNQNPFQQTWVPGILQNSKLLSSTDNVAIPIQNNDEETNGNKLQQYYDYYNYVGKDVAQSIASPNNPLNGVQDTGARVPIGNRLIGQTQIYTENTNLLPITNVFRNSDQGHDYYTDGRNVRGSFTYPTSANSVSLSDYSRLTANTTFGGGNTICALLFMPNTTHDYLMGQQRTYNNINYPQLSAAPLTRNNINALLNARLPAKPLINNNIFNCTVEGIIYDVGNDHMYCLLPLSMKGYDKGMHKLTEFKEGYKLYGVTYNQQQFDGYLLYESNLIVPQLEFDMTSKFNNNSSLFDDITELLKTGSLATIINSKTTITTITLIGKLRKLYQNNEFSPEQKNTIDDAIYEVFKRKFPNFISQRGVTYFFKNCPTSNDDNMEFILLIIMKKLYAELSYTVNQWFVSYLPQVNSLIDTDYNLKNYPPLSPNQGLSNSVDKTIAFTTDTTTGPSERSLIAYYNNSENTGPYRFTIVSNAIDGSGQGGQIYPEYHPPDLDVYMNIFDTNNLYLGSIFRFTFLSNIMSNALNSKGSVFVELHYCYIAVNDFQILPDNAVSIDGKDVTLITNTINTMIKHILFNTIVNRTNDLLQLITINKNQNEKQWVFTKVEDAPSVELTNKATVPATFINKLNIIKRQAGITTVNTATVSLYNALFSCICSRTTDVIEKFLTAALALYQNNATIFGPVFVSEENFCKIFLLRNKFIGDKSRATDALFMNKNSTYECVQSSNDVNTLSTAYIYNLSSQLLTATSSNKFFYFAPYVTYNDNPLQLGQPAQLGQPLQLGQPAQLSQPAQVQNSSGAGIGTYMGLNNTKTPKSEIKRIDKNTYDIQIQSTGTRRSERGQKAGKVPALMQGYFAQSFEEQPRLEDTGNGRLNNKEYVEGQIEGHVEDQVEKHIYADQNTILGLQNNLDTLIRITSKYQKRSIYEIELTSDAILILMLLDRVDYLLQNMSNVSYTTDSLIEKLQTYLRGETHLNQSAIYLNTVFKSIFDMFSEANMLDIYGISYSYSQNIFDDEIVETPNESVPSKISGLEEEGKGYENADKESDFKEEPDFKEESPSEKAKGLQNGSGRNIIKYKQTGGAITFSDSLKIIYKYYTNNFDDISKRINDFKEWYDNETIAQQFFVAPPRVSGTRVINEMTPFVENNAKIFDMIFGIKTFLDSIDYTEDFVSPQAEISYISISFFLIKLCTDFRLYLVKMYSYYFRRLNYITLKNTGASLNYPGSPENARSADYTLPSKLTITRIDYENLFEPRQYSRSQSTSSAVDPAEIAERSYVLWTVPVRDLETISDVIGSDGKSQNLVFPENVLNEIISFEPPGIVDVTNISITQTRGYIGSSVDVLIPTPPDTPYRISLSKNTSFEFLTIKMISDKIKTALDHISVEGYQVNRPLTEEGVDPVTRRTKIYIQAITGAILFLIDQNERIEYLISQFFTNFRGYSVDNYYASNISKNTITKYKNAFTITFGTGEIQFNLNSSNSIININQNVDDLLSVYIYNKILFCLLLTPTQVDNFKIRDINSGRDIIDSGIKNQLNFAINSYLNFKPNLTSFIFALEANTSKLAEQNRYKELQLIIEATAPRNEYIIPPEMVNGPQTMQPSGQLSAAQTSLNKKMMICGTGAAIGTAVGAYCSKWITEKASGSGAAVGATVGATVGYGVGFVGAYIAEKMGLLGGKTKKRRRNLKRKTTIKLNKLKNKKSRKDKKNKKTRKQ